MSLNKKVSKFTIKLPCSFSNLLKKIDNTGLGIIFVITKKNKIYGSISDGDLRRGLLKNNHKLIMTQD